MSGSGFQSVVSHVPTVSLAEVEQTAPLIFRRERKYLVPEHIATGLVQEIAERVRVLSIEGKNFSHYESVYFDTTNRESYFMSARSRRHAYKVRTRSYLGAKTSLLEVKQRGSRSQNQKFRTEHVFDERTKMDAQDAAFATATLGKTVEAGDMSPALTVTYTRTTLLVSDGSRLTIDADLHIADATGQASRLDGYVVIETKSRSKPTIADRALWHMGYRPNRFSKFGTGSALLHPELPANRWARVLRAPWTYGARKADRA